LDGKPRVEVGSADVLDARVETKVSPEGRGGEDEELEE